MRLRVATLEDSDSVASVLGPSYTQLMAAAYPPDLLARTLPSITRANPVLLSSGRYYLAEADDGRPAGCGGWSADPPDRADGDPGRAHIRHFATHPGWTRRGVGRLLYERCEADARAAGFTLFEVYASLNGEAFYAALGFRPLGRIETPMPGGVRFPAIRMVRAL
ncbi:MAG TPA: GNAT family N-acetyltransferase [Allosphingosinicella sp.]|jgi:GNAT superfamily N-acetyltransferase|nr:GNAT family N-acetyltransferase [Allosphingosinicella sp.]